MKINAYIAIRLTTFKIEIMGTYTKIKTIPLSIFNNAEYLAFLNSVLNLVPAPTGGGDRPEIESLDADVRTNGSPDIGLSAQFVQKMENDVMLLADTKAASHRKRNKPPFTKPTATTWSSTSPPASRAPAPCRSKPNVMPESFSIR